MSFDFGEAFASGVAEVGGTFRRESRGVAWIGTDEHSLQIAWSSNGDYFRAVAGAGERPSLEFGCIMDGWEEYQAKDAGRDFAERAYEIAGRLPR